MKVLYRNMMKLIKILYNIYQRSYKNFSERCVNDQVLLFEYLHFRMSWAILFQIRSWFLKTGNLHVLTE